MKIFKYIFLLFFVSPTFAQNQTNIQSTGFFEDFKIFREILETSHSGMYLYTTKAEFDSIFYDAESQLENNEIATLRSYNLLLAKIITKINCGHSYIAPCKVIFEQIDDIQNAFFPLKVKILKDTFIVAETYKHLKKGTKIKSINGRDFNTIRKDAFTVLTSDGYNTTLKDRYFELEFADYYFLLYGATEKFELEIIPFGLQQIEKTTIAACKNNRREDLLERPELIDYQFQILNNEIALLTINTFDSNQRKFYKFLRNSFKEIKDQDINKLIIDVRENEGGMDGNDTKLASYLINKEFQDNKYRLINTLDLPIYPEYLDSEWIEMMEMSKRTSSEKIPIKMKRILSKEFYKGDNNKYYYKENKHIKESPDKNLFSGKTYILTGGKVFSAGSLFCSLVKDKSDAIFVGEEVGGGYYRHTGSYPFYYTLPNSQISFKLSIVINEQDIGQNIMPQGRGVIPDFEVYQTIENYVNNYDAVLEFAIEKIRN